MKIVFKILRFILKFILGIILLLLLIFSVYYLSCPVYKFDGGTPFHGESIYNPYEHLDSTQWHKANFQVQSYAWGGITSGSGNSNEAIYNLYKSLGYDIIATSDYEKINTWAADKPGYVPVYEHGYGIKKWHQVLLGSKQVLWKDYPFFQSLSNKQDIINSLRTDNELTYIAHPLLRHGYSVDDFKKLSNYDGIEVLNNYRTSLDHWDAALSSGNFVSILSNDDAHDISNPDEIGHHCTLINCKSLKQEDIISSLREGNAFGAKIFRVIGESFETKRAKAKNLPQIKEVSVVNDSLIIVVDSMAKEFRFIGQGGKIIGRSRNTCTAFYPVRESDTYVRTEIEFTDGTTFYLNPICRYNGVSPSKIPLAMIDFRATWILRIVGFASLIFLLVNYYILRKRYKKSKLQRSPNNK